MIVSMTGYGRASWQSGDDFLGVQLRSVNHRQLRLSFRMPDVFSPLQQKIDQELKRELRRGSVDFILSAQLAPQAASHQINPAALEDYLQQIARAAEALSLPMEVGMKDLLALPGVLVPREVVEYRRAEELYDRVLELTRRALEQLLTMRRREGKNLERAIRQSARRIASRVKKLSALNRKAVSRRRDVLQSQMVELLAAFNVEPDEGKLLHEAALLAQRSDITEEVDRLSSHLDQLTGLLEAPEPVGRRIEFLAQEIYREANTISSKSASVEVSRLALEIRGEVEKIREQSQNVE